MKEIIVKVKMQADSSLVGCVASEIIEVRMTKEDYHDIQKMEKIINTTFERWVWNKISSSSYWEIVEEKL